MTLSKRPQVQPAAYRPDRVADAPLTQEVYEAVKTAVAEAYPRQAQRNLLLLETFQATGLRKAEVLRLQARELAHDGPSYFLWVVRSKRRGKQRGIPEKVFINDYLGARLAAYVLGKPPTATVFDIKARMVNYLFEAATKRLSVHVWPHQTRRMVYSWLRQHGLPGVAAAAYIGDTERVAEAHYLQELDDNQKREIAQRIPT